VRDLRNGNDILRSQIRTIDDQTAKINQALQRLQSVLQQNGLSGGLGDAQELISLQQEQSATEPLKQQLATKGRNLQVLIETFNKIITQTYDAIYGKKRAQSIVLYGLLAVGVGAVIYAIIPNKKTNG
jgi:chaperonin cofactor prefoldin